MRRRPSSRLLVVNPDGAVLLFRFVQDIQTGESYWATPGGALEGNETFEEAAIRELFEETGIKTNNVGPEIGRQDFVLRLTSGEEVIAEEVFFLIRHDGAALSFEGWTEEEVRAIADHRWWSGEDFAKTSDTFFPENILSMLPSPD